MSLFAEQESARLRAAAPLPVRMRPRTLDEFTGQQHFLGEGKLLRRLLLADRISSVIFYGPPGCGKTTLAHIVAEHTQAEFVSLNATTSGVKEVREALDQARARLSTGNRRTLLFVDEIHRFNRAQQDVLLSDVEAGTAILIGATTENPFFSINAPLVSRSQIFQFESLSEADITQLLQRALTDADRGLGRHIVTVTDEAIAFLATCCDGDARRALNGLEIAVLSVVGSMTQAGDAVSGGDTPPLVDLTVAQDSMQRKAIHYDGTGDEHYDVTSALIKSMRGGDPDATVYWLARMLTAGEDPRFIARRIAICASEDVGGADPVAIMLANAAMQITQNIGMPECQLALAHAAIYIACAPKSNAVAKAIWSAMKDVRDGRTIPVPKHLRDAHYGGAKSLGHGKDYQYSHDHPDSLAPQDYLGVDVSYYQPTDHGREKTMREHLERFRAIQSRATAAESTKKPGKPS